MIKNRYIHWVILLVPSIFAYLYDASLRQQEFYKLNPHISPDSSGLHYVTQSMSNYIYVPLICFAVFALLTFIGASKKPSLKHTVLSKLTICFAGAAALLASLLMYVFFTGQVTQ